MKKVEEEDEFVTLTMVFVPTLELLEEVKQHYSEDASVQELLHKVTKGDASPKYSIREGCLYYKDVLYIPKDPTLKLKLLHLVHNSSIGGHSGFDKTIHTINREFY